MPYRLDFVSSASREFLALPAAMRERVDKRLIALTDSPRPSGVKRLRGGTDLWRIRVGDYRVVYLIDDQRKVITVTRVRARATAYRHL